MICSPTMMPRNSYFVVSRDTFLSYPCAYAAGAQGVRWPVDLLSQQVQNFIGARRLHEVKIEARFARACPVFGLTVAS